MSRLRTPHMLPLLLGLFIAGCGAAPATEDRALSGRRVQRASVAAHGGVPYELATYELVVADTPDARGSAWRTALLVDFLGGQGQVRGFAEWGHSGATPQTYVVGGWARHKILGGEPVTVFELGLHHLAVQGAPRQAADPEHSAPPAVRVVVHEASGDVTLTLRR